MARIVGVVLLLALSCPGQSQEQSTTLPTRITRIRFSGVSVIPVQKLEAVARRYEDHVFPASKIEQAYTDFLEDIHTAYEDEGFVEGQGEFIPQVDADGPQEREVSLNVTVREGQKYTLSAVQWEGADHFHAANLNDLLGLHVPDTFHRGEIAKAMEKLRMLYAKDGFLFMVAVPRTEMDHQALTIDITVDVHEDGQYKFGAFRVYPGVRPVDSKRVEAIWSGLSGATYSEKSWNEVVAEAERLHLYLYAKYDTHRHLVNAELMPRSAE